MTPQFVGGFVTACFLVLIGGIGVIEAAMGGGASRWHRLAVAVIFGALLIIGLGLLIAVLFG